LKEGLVNEALEEEALVDMGECFLVEGGLVEEAVVFRLDKEDPLSQEILSNGNGREAEAEEGDEEVCANERKGSFLILERFADDFEDIFGRDRGGG